MPAFRGLSDALVCGASALPGREELAHAPAMPHALLPFPTAAFGPAASELHLVPKLPMHTAPLPEGSHDNQLELPGTADKGAGVDWHKSGPFVVAPGARAGRGAAKKTTPTKSKGNIKKHAPAKYKADGNTK